MDGLFDNQMMSDMVSVYRCLSANIRRKMHKTAYEWTVGGEICRISV